MNNEVAIIKYNAGNVQSVQNALQRLGKVSVVTNDHDEIRSASHVIFPGVGHAQAAMSFLKELDLDIVIKSLTQPVLGVCLGMQLLCKHTEEGDTACMGIFDNDVKLFPSALSSNMKIPQMGWNNITRLSSKLFENIREDAFVYYVHSYYATLSAETIATTDYIQEYSGALQKNNFYAVQFHPEKSGKVGEQILSNFLSIT